MVIKALVTGHSRGLGHAVAVALLKRDIPVLGLSRGVSKQQDKSGLTEVQLDLSDQQAVLTWLGQNTFKQFVSDAELFLLINNAGTVQPIGPAHQLNLKAISYAVALNVSTPLVLSSALAGCDQRIKKRVLHISSGASQSAYSGWGVYCATKAALDHNARAAAQDDNNNFDIVSLAPGVIDTDMQSQLRGCSSALFPNVGRFKSLHENGQLTTPQVVADKIVEFVLSSQFARQAVADLRQFN